MSNCFGENLKLYELLRANPLPKGTVYCIVLNDVLLNIPNTSKPIFIKRDGDSGSIEYRAFIKKAKTNEEDVSAKVGGIFTNLLGYDCTYKFRSFEGDPSQGITKSVTQTLDNEVLLRNNCDYTVYIDNALKLLFINTPMNVFLKRNVAKIRTNVIGDRDTFEQFENMYQYFISESIMNYSIFYDTIARNYLYRNTRKIIDFVFKPDGSGRQLYESGYLHLSYSIGAESQDVTKGLYNPFRDIEELRIKFNEFKNTAIENDSMFVVDSIDSSSSSTKPYRLLCITPLDLCRELGLKKKLGFSTSKAIQYLGSILLEGNGITLPSPYITKYIYDRPMKDGTIRREYVWDSLDSMGGNLSPTKSIAVLVLNNENFEMFMEGTEVDVKDLVDIKRMVLGVIVSPFKKLKK